MLTDGAVGEIGAATEADRLAQAVADLVHRDGEDGDGDADDGPEGNQPPRGHGQAGEEGSKNDCQNAKSNLLQPGHADALREVGKDSTPAGGARRVGPARRPIYSAKMRIVHVNWAKIWDGAARGGGANGYAQALALEQVRLGHEVASLSAGTEEVPGVDPGTHNPFAGRCAVRRHHDWRGIKVFEVINSPVLAPGVFQFRDPLPEISSPELEAEVSRFMGLIRPDVVHFHNIEGFSAGCIRAVRGGDGAGPRVVFSLHNYHTVCPQVYLMRRGRLACHDFRSGLECAECAKALPRHFEPETERTRRWQGAMVRLGISVPKVSDSEPDEKGNLPLPFLPADETGHVEGPSPMQGPDPRGTEREVEEMGTAGPGSEEWQPLSNDVPAAPPVGAEANNFAARRAAMVEGLNNCDRVLAVSRFVKKKFQQMGVRPTLLSTMTIGSRAPEIAAARAAAAPPAFDRSRPRPLRLVFMGYNNYYKGLHMLADALEQMDAASLSRLDLHVHALDMGSIESRLLRLEGALGGLSLRGGYLLEDLPDILSGKDAGIVPSVWWDNGPQTVLEFLSFGLPVIGAALGGIPDFITDGVNGVLFRGNDRADLARVLGELGAAPWRVEDLRRGVRPPKTIGEHAMEIESLYRSLVGEPVGA